ncbi:MAG: ABC transporter substrate-binding protein, partial [Chloroflexi bacterium]|nr:ABC transporter substrate-binding protein [Chloroflexota bacterium]
MKFQAASILKRVWLLAIVVLLAACANPDLACEDALGCVTVRPNEPIRIGYLLAESGEAAFLGADSKGGIELAIDDRATGVLDRQIELAGRDTGCDTDKGLMAAQTLTAVPSLIGIIGANCSHVAETVMPIVFDAGLVMLSPSNTAPNLTANQSWRGAYVRTAPSDWRQADAAAAFAYEELGGETAVILH